MRIGEANKDNYKISVRIPGKDLGSTVQGKEPGDQTAQKAQDQITISVTDEVTISGKAKIKSKEETSFADALEKMRAESRELQRQLEAARKQSEGAAEYYRRKLKCILIAMRIMQGDKVPPEDHSFLAEEEPELYQKAMSLRIEKEDPEEYDRVSEDEKNDYETPDDEESTPVRMGNGEVASEAEADSGTF